MGAFVCRTSVPRSAVPIRGPLPDTAREPRRLDPSARVLDEAVRVGSRVGVVPGRRCAGLLLCTSRQGPWWWLDTLPSMSDQGLTHLDPLGRARMVDVTPKEPSHRRALARARVHMKPETTSLVAKGAVSKGDVLAVARVAGIQAAKRTPDLIPLCHPLLVGSVFVNFVIEDTFVEVEAEVETVDRTGVEMEALTACSVAALTVYDMCKSVDKSMVIGDVALWEKSGGRSGSYRRAVSDDI